LISILNTFLNREKFYVWPWTLQREICRESCFSRSFYPIKLSRIPTFVCSVSSYRNFSVYSALQGHRSQGVWHFGKALGSIWWSEMQQNSDRFNGHLFRASRFTDCTHSRSRILRSQSVIPTFKLSWEIDKLRYSVRFLHFNLILR
jgi:hypothetical protein